MIRTSSFNRNLSGIQYKLTNIVCVVDHNKTPYLIKGALKNAVNLVNVWFSKSGSCCS
jgi:transketolase N-terminal domain/subunit